MLLIVDQTAHFVPSGLDRDYPQMPSEATVSVKEFIHLKKSILACQYSQSAQAEEIHVDLCRNLFATMLLL